MGRFTGFEYLYGILNILMLFFFNSNNKCSPAISSYTKPIDGNTIGAEMEARLDGPEDVFPWRE